MPNLIFMHEDMLRQNHPVFTEAGNKASAFFIWDEAYFEAQAYSFKRLVFIYETISELSVTLYHGNHQEILKILRARQDVFMAKTLNPTYVSLAEQYGIKVVQDIPFATLKKPDVPRRFFPYWNQVKKALLTP